MDLSYIEHNFQAQLLRLVWIYVRTDLIIIWADLLKMWDGVFCSASTPIEYAEILDNLRSKYCPKCWQAYNIESF